MLAIAAARLGYAPVLAVDVEPASLEASAVNAERNGAEIEVRRVNLRREPAPWAPTVTANLVRPLLLDVARLLERAPERLIMSGLLREEADEVVAAFGAHGLVEGQRRFGGEWAAVLLDRGVRGRAATKASAVPALASTTERAFTHIFSRRGGTAGSTRTTWPSLPSQIRSSGKRIVKV